MLLFSVAMKEATGGFLFKALDVILKTFLQTQIAKFKKIWIFNKQGGSNVDDTELSYSVGILGFIVFLLLYQHQELKIRISQASAASFLTLGKKESVSPPQWEPL